MRHKIIIFFLIFFIILTIFVILLKNSAIKTNAEIIKPQNQDNLIRVGISTNDFSALEYNQVSITSSGKFELIDKSTGTLIAELNPEDIAAIKIDDITMSVYNFNKPVKENIIGPIIVKSPDNLPIQIVGLKRAGKQAAYRGEIEIIKAPTRNNKFSVVNILPLEEYLKGVVPNELYPSFGLEALKAQAIAARNYAVKPKIKPYSQFDICDSVACQVYFGYNTENNLADQAIKETNGLISLYNGDIILALYSSAAGGYTENSENVFSEPEGSAFPGNPVPYLRGKPDIKGIPVLDNEEAARWFYNASIPCYDSASSYYRWSRTWSRIDLESILNKNLANYASSPFISPKPEKDSDIGTLMRIEVLKRGVSGKAMIVKIVTSTGEWEIKKELLIRKIFENSDKMLPSANIIFDNQFDEEGNLIQITVSGWGLGHGVGLSQFGAGYMSKHGYTYNQILQHYYDGTSIGTVPVTLSPDILAEPVRQIFYSPTRKTKLILENINHLSNFKMMVNSKEINIPHDWLKKDHLRASLENYTHKGLNKIEYYHPKSNDGKDLKAWIEVFSSNDKK